MRVRRYVPPVFEIARDNEGFNIFLHHLVETFPEAERKPEAHVFAKAADLFRDFLDATSSSQALATARCLVQFPHWSDTDQWQDAIASSMGFLTFEVWLERVFPEQFERFLRKHQLAKLTIEERGPRHDREAGVSFQAGSGKIAYVHPYELQRTVFTCVHSGMVTVVPRIPSAEAKLLRTQPNGTRVFALDLRVPEIR